MAEQESSVNNNPVPVSIKQPVILLACGCFNPVTNMHLRMFEVARDTLHQTGRFRVISGIISPVGDNYSKNGLISASHRIEIIKCAISTSNWIKLDTWESEQPNWIESVYVLRRQRDISRTANQSVSNVNKLVAGGGNSSSMDSPARKKRVVSSPGIVPKQSSEVVEDLTEVNVMFLCGADVLETMINSKIWKPEHVEEILRDFGVVVCDRVGSHLEKFIYEYDILTKYKNNIYIMRDWITNEISSTKIRRALKRGESIKYLVQDPAIDYIKYHKLYDITESK